MALIWTTRPTPGCQNNRIVSVAVILAIGVNNDGGAKCWAWISAPLRPRPSGRLSWRSSRRRGSRGDKLVTSDAHEGIKAAVRQGDERDMATLPRPLHAQRARRCRQERSPRRLCFHRDRLRAGRRWSCENRSRRRSLINYAQPSASSPSSWTRPVADVLCMGLPEDHWR